MGGTGLISHAKLYNRMDTVKDVDQYLRLEELFNDTLASVSSSSTLASTLIVGVCVTHRLS